MKNFKYKLFTKIKANALSLLVFKNKILSRLTTKQSCKIVMILGYQRSGTSALISSFEKDEDYAIYTESNNSLLMYKWLLRPEKNIRFFLNKTKKIITKPITESYIRTSGELFEEYKNYDIQYILLVRSVENIFYSNSKHDNEYYGNDIEKFIPLYNKRMKNTLTGLDKKNGLVIKYEDIIDKPVIYDKICDFLGLKGDYIFRKDSNLGLKNLSDNQQTILNNRTLEIKSKTDLLVSKTYEKLGIY